MDQKTGAANGSFISDLSATIERFRPALWIHGHVHDTHIYDVGETHIVCNPRGYPSLGRYENLAGFIPDLVVEIPDWTPKPRMAASGKGFVYVSDWKAELRRRERPAQGEEVVADNFMESDFAVGPEDVDAQVKSFADIDRSGWPVCRSFDASTMVADFVSMNSRPPFSVTLHKAPPGVMVFADMN